MEHLENLHERAAVRMDAQTEILLVSLSDYARAEDALTLDLDQESACALMNKLFHQPALKGYLVNLDENYFKVVDEPLKWICQDDPIEPGLLCPPARHVHRHQRLPLRPPASRPAGAVPV